jgi:hypothetical protein
MREMKKIVLLLSILLIFNSCTLDDEPNAALVVLPIKSVVMPTAFNIDVNSQIIIKYIRPTTCHLFNGFYYRYEGDTRVVAVNAAVLNSSNCEAAAEEGTYEVVLDFRPKELKTYLFKFWTGTNAEGVDEYLEYEAVVN